MANPYVYVILGIFLIALIGGGLFLLMALGVLPPSFLGAVQRLGGQLGGAVSNVVFTQPPGGVNSKGQLLFNGTPPGYGNPNGFTAPYSVDLVGINFCYPYDAGYLWLEPNHTYTFNVTLYATYGMGPNPKLYGTTVPVVLTSDNAYVVSGLNVTLVPNEGQLPFNATLIITVGPRIIVKQGSTFAYYPGYGYVAIAPNFNVNSPGHPMVGLWMGGSGSLTLRIAPQYVYFQNGTPVTATPGLP
jgi:hypothetical protein